MPKAARVSIEISPKKWRTSLSPSASPELLEASKPGHAYDTRYKRQVSNVLEQSFRTRATDLIMAVLYGVCSVMVLSAACYCGHKSFALKHWSTHSSSMDNSIIPAPPAPTSIDMDPVVTFYSDNVKIYTEKKNRDENQAYVMADKNESILSSTSITAASVSVGTRNSGLFATEMELLTGLVDMAV